VSAPASSPSPADPPAVTIRPIRAGDKQALRDGCNRLSERTRYRRFLSPHGSLTPAELRYLTEVDHHDHEGVKRFTALMPADNDRMLHLIRELGVVHDLHRADGIVELTVDLPGQGAGDVSRLLRATARGDVEAVGRSRASLNRQTVVS
jgi:hypothetical protein